MRLDLYLFQNGFVKSRQKAKVLIEEGNVKVNGMVAKKPSFDVIDDAKIEVFDDCPYVSRGGLKLEGILNVTGEDVRGKICIDIGASTGGFTHCLILKGAKKVYAIDSGTNQLAAELRIDSRVVSIENFNARSLTLDTVGEKSDIITIDVSFISQNLILPNINQLLNDDGVLFSLIKPQFEVGKALVGKGGIVKDKKARLIAVNSVLACASQHGFICNKFLKSPIQGGDGNVEYLASFSKNGNSVSEEYIKKIVFE